MRPPRPTTPARTLTHPLWPGALPRQAVSRSPTGLKSPHSATVPSPSSPFPPHCGGPYSSLVLCASSTGYGERGAPPKIPGKAAFSPSPPVPHSPSPPSLRLIRHCPLLALQGVRPWCSRWNCSRSRGGRSCSRTDRADWGRGTNRDQTGEEKQKQTKKNP